MRSLVNSTCLRGEYVRVEVDNGDSRGGNRPERIERVAGRLGEGAYADECESECDSGPERDVPGHWRGSEVTQSERVAQASSSSSFFSTTRVSVVRTRAAIDAALRSAERVTLTGSMIPAPMRSPYSPLAAL